MRNRIATEDMRTNFMRAAVLVHQLNAFVRLE